tara:strand:- start:4567 stop:5403 length:837 start_codon:yes stop_codon:yes gene_type:complete
MKKVIFVADIFSDAYSGGAENNDSVLIKYLLKNDFDVEKIKSYELTSQKIKQNNVFLISNFISLTDENKTLLKDKKYIIYEHDHKYVTTRDPSKFPNFTIPPEKIINLGFYENAHSVVVLSEICKHIMIQNLNLKNVYNIGCSLWSDQRLDFIKRLSSKEKNNKFVVLNSNNPIKNTKLALDYCNKNSIPYDLLNSCNEKSFLEKISEYKGLVFFPGVLETFSRVSAEAKMMNCKLLTKPSLLGFASEDNFELSGQELIESIRERKNKALGLFRELLC